MELPFSNFPTFSLELHAQFLSDIIARGIVRWTRLRPIRIYISCKCSPNHLKLLLFSFYLLVAFDNIFDSPFHPSSEFQMQLIGGGSIVHQSVLGVARPDQTRSRRDVFTLTTEAHTTSSRQFVGLTQVCIPTRVTWICGVSLPFINEFNHSLLSSGRYILCWPDGWMDRAMALTTAPSLDVAADWREPRGRDEGLLLDQPRPPASPSGGRATRTGLEWRRSVSRQGQRCRDGVSGLQVQVQWVGNGCKCKGTSEMRIEVDVWPVIMCTAWGLWALRGRVAA